MTLRISGGIFKSRILKPTDSSLKPTTDFFRQVVFNWLKDDIKNTIVLDGFAGSGIFGIEAISRGAQFVSFVEQSKNLCFEIEKYCSQLRIPISQYEVLCSDTLHLKKIKYDQYSLIFLDPPYKEFKLLVDSYNYLKANMKIKKYGFIICETASKNPLPVFEGSTLLKVKKAGMTSMTLWQYDIK